MSNWSWSEPNTYHWKVYGASAYFGKLATMIAYYEAIAPGQGTAPYLPDKIIYLMANN